MPDPETLRLLCHVAEIQADVPLRVDLPGHKPFAVYNLDGDIYVTDDTCTHGDASLSEGEIEDGAIVCPFHQGAFDIRTGRAVIAPCRLPLRVHRVRVEGGHVMLVEGG